MSRITVAEHPCSWGPGGYAETVGFLAKKVLINAKDKDFPDYYVEIRADHRVNFGAVQEVLKAAAAAGIHGINMKMNITALTTYGRGE